LIAARTTPLIEPSSVAAGKAAIDAVDQVVAEGEIARAHRLGKIGTVGDVQPDGARVGRANDLAVSPGDAKTAKPRNVAGQIGEHMTAIGRVERGPGVDAGDDLQQGTHGISDLALRFGTAACHIDHLSVGVLGAFGASSFEAAHALEH
jgi:hypothetical protein